MPAGTPRCRRGGRAPRSGRRQPTRIASSETRAQATARWSGRGAAPMRPAAPDPLPRAAGWSRLRTAGGRPPPAPDSPRGGGPMHPLRQEPAPETPHGPHTLRVWSGTVVGIFGDDVFVELGPRMQGVIATRHFAAPPRDRRRVRVHAARPGGGPLGARARDREEPRHVGGDGDRQRRAGARRARRAGRARGQDRRRCTPSCPSRTPACRATRSPTRSSARS